METPEAKETYKLRSKTSELPFAHMKQNIQQTKFRTTGLNKLTQNSNYIQQNTISKEYTTKYTEKTTKK